jgi:hypothetical protein
MQSAAHHDGRDSIIYHKTLHYKTKRVDITFSASGVIVIKDLSAQTILKRDSIGRILPGEIRIEDYNNDGVKDIRYGYNSNYYCENVLLFDPASKTWKEIKDMNSTHFAYSQRIPQTQVYYSYSPDGCGKNNWVSYLFIIKDFTVKPIGLIQYKQCQDDQNGIYFYKIYKGTKKLLRKLPLQPMNKGNIYESYWIKNYKQYLE